MSLRFFADHCVPTSISQALLDAGHTVLLLRDHMPKDSEDSQVIAKSQELQSILLSLNGDFSNIVSYPPSKFGGITAIQVRNHPETIPVVVQQLLIYADSHPDQWHYEGKLFLVEPHRIRIRFE
jgi:predicted nuclease of predicted toxin-antitoxin system